MTAVSVLRMPARPGSEDELVRAFAELDVFAHSRRSGGFRAGRLLRPVTAGAPFVVIAEWDGPADYERWLANPVRERLREALAPLLAGELEGGVYEEAHGG